MNLDTEIIDQLFLELSQVTKATTARELKYRTALQEILDRPHDPDGTTEMFMRLTAKEALKP